MHFADFAQHLSLEGATCQVPGAQWPAIRATAVRTRLIPK
jgi:hypothetical protein